MIFYIVGTNSGGSLNPKTSGRGSLFMDNYNRNWKFFLTDENGKETNRKETGISVTEYYVDSTYVIDGKGYKFQRCLIINEYDTIGHSVVNTGS